MSGKPLVIHPGDRRPALHVIGINVTVLISGKDSPGQKITLQSGEEAAGPPPHCHDWDESFHVTRGQVEFTCNDQIVMCTEGRSARRVQSH